ncbi:MAG: hypothetical protein LBJ02_07265 [Bifidobacteriaceae bacterium]|jgi:hypothetical protein|nr:hypothetical protein [Bifidobacteriaceae bacterium]
MSGEPDDEQRQELDRLDREVEQAEDDQRDQRRLLDEAEDLAHDGVMLFRATVAELGPVGGVSGKSMEEYLHEALSLENALGQDREELARQARALVAAAEERRQLGRRAVWGDD